ncbi:hypothetical protein VCR15J2_90031 [Vibrio coralliirubri]|nr:hypothetical protein VCR15J2_90031 [Vibrio coralliirubri]
MFCFYHPINALGVFMLAKESFGIEVKNGKGSNDSTWRSAAT